MGKLTDAFKRALQALRVRVPMSGSEWANEHFYLSPESSGTEGQWQCYPYQVAWLDWMTSDDIEEVNFQKSRRVGYTKCLMAAMACQIEQKNRNVAIWHPTDKDAKDFVTDEIEPLLRDVEVLGSKLKCDVDAKSKYNTLEKKAFRGATLDVKGGKSARNFRRMTKDMAIYDETDGFDIDIDNEGSCFELGDGRLDQAVFPKSIRGSTPKTKGLSLIETAVGNSDRVFYRFVKCPHCGAIQRLEFKRLFWDEGQPETAQYDCVTDGCEMQYRDYPAADAEGRWQTLDGYYYDEESQQFFNSEDQPIRKPRKIGVRIWAGYSYLRPWSYLVDRWLDATKNAKSGMITTLKTVINTLLGETFEEKGAGVDASAVDDRGEKYLEGGTIPNGVLCITAGADVQGGDNTSDPRIECEILGHGLEGETWSLGYHVLKGSPERPEVWENLDEKLKQVYTREDGVRLKISAAFIDSGHLQTRVCQFTAPRAKRGIFATKGRDDGPLVHKGVWVGDKNNKSRAIQRKVNTHEIKEIIYNRLAISWKPDENGNCQGYCHFPAHYPPEYYKQLTNEEKVEKRERGVLKGFKWRKKIGDRNEALDCRVYAIGAFEFLNPNMPRLKLRLEKRAVAKAKKSAAGKPPKKTQKRAKLAKKGWVSSYG